MNNTLHGAFVREGRMVAFPLSYPGASAPVPADESLLQVLDTAADGTIYAGTGGRAAHLVAGLFAGVTGAVFDLGRFDDMQRTVAIGCSDTELIAWLDGEAGSRLVSRALERLPYDLTQEGGFTPQPFTDLGDPTPGRRPVAAVRTPNRKWIVGATAQDGFRLNLESHELTQVPGISTAGALGVTADGIVLGIRPDRSAWRYDPAGDVEIGALELPEGSWDFGSWCFGRGSRGEARYLADCTGGLMAVGPKGSLEPVARAPRGPVTALAVSADNRVFGTCGAQLESLFCFDPVTETIQDLGLIASVLQSRRYAWSLSDAVVGRDGEIIFAEQDDLGHLWLYFPRIVARR